jgi:hypothetical protein
MEGVFEEQASWAKRSVRMRVKEPIRGTFMIWSYITGGPLKDIHPNYDTAL